VKHVFVAYFGVGNIHVYLRQSRYNGILPLIRKKGIELILKTMYLGATF
jgi:hypothetical protein